MTVSGMSECKISMKQAVTTKVSPRVTACGREVMMPILGLVWQESVCAVAAMSRKTTVKSDFTSHQYEQLFPFLKINCFPENDSIIDFFSQDGTKKFFF